MKQIMIVAGVPGSGKSTILTEAMKQFPKLHLINYGEMMLQEALSQNINKDTLRKLPLAEQQQIGLQAAQKMAKNMPHYACIDTHAMIKTPFGFCPGLPEAVVRLLKPTVVVMIECAPELIHQRRLNDKSRNRDLETLEDISYHQEISRSFLVACTAMAGALFMPIQNNNTPQAAAKQLLSILNTFGTQT